ncbi:NYN domain-containing protein [Patescibacteria group bacterium]|nr:NYN domain-containing protein [Patescibacteria group bacterium]
MLKAIIKDSGINTPTAIFIDGSWLYATTKRINKNIDYAKFFNILIKKFGAKTKVYYYGVIDPVSKQQEKFYISLKKIGYIVHCVKLRKIGDRVIPGGLDISLAVDAMRILPSLKNFVLVSGDSDFVALLQQARQAKVNTYVIALPLSIGYLLRQVTNTFLNLETLTVEYKPKSFRKGLRIEKLATQNYIKEGESFKSYIKLRDLMKSAKNNITIVDQYIDDQILLMIQPLKPGVNKIIITNAEKITTPDFFVQVKKLKKDGHLLDIYESKKFHDRFIGIDNTWWHSGHSFKNLGEKDSMLNKIGTKAVKKINDEIIKVIDNSNKL